jgi:pimeloyl-ACP methyl ester carboxylesterase
MLLLAPALTYLAGKYTEAERQQWQREGAINLPHYAFGGEVPLQYDFHLDGLRYLEPVPPPTRMLIIHGRNDEVVPLENSRRYAAGYPDQTQLVEVDSDHRLNDRLDLIWEHVGSFLLS